MISFACPVCNRELSIHDQYAGKHAQCPKCKKRLLVPAPAPVAIPVRPVASPAPISPSIADAVTVAPVGNTVPSPRPAGPANWKLDFLAKAQRPEELGRLGTYRVLKVIGAGGMGIVLLADDPVLKRPVALKVMRPELAKDRDARRRFLREARSTAAIDHPNIVPIHQVAQEKGVPFIVMPLLQGEPLDARLHRQKRLPVGDVLAIGKQIAEGLDAAHKRGLIHRDIKPGNIFLVSGEVVNQGDVPTITYHASQPSPRTTHLVKIVDFGLAHWGDDVRLTQTGTVLGTPAYMSPEQARGDKVDLRSDLFSLGSVLYEMLTGELPFKGCDMMSILTALATQTPAPVRSVNPEVPPALADLVMQLLTKEPTKRPASAKAVAETLAGLAGDSTAMPVAARKSSTVRMAGFLQVLFRMLLRVGKWCGVRLWSLRPWAFRRPGLAFAVEGAVLGLVLLLLSFPLLARKQDVASRDRERTVNKGAKDLAESPGTKSGILEGHTGRITGVAFSTDGKLLATSSVDKTVRQWDLVTGKESGRYEGNQRLTNEVIGLVTSADRSLFCAYTKFESAIHDFASRKQVLGLHLTDLRLPYAGMAFVGRDSDRMVKAYTNGAMQLLTFDQQGSWTEQSFSGNAQTIVALVSSGDGKRFFIGTKEGTLEVWEMGKYDGPLRRINAHKGAVRALAASPDGKLLVSSGADDKVLLWDTETGKELRQFQAGAVSCIAFSPDGRRVLTGGDDKTVRVWDVQSAALLQTFKGHTDSVSCVAFSRDGTQAASGSLDRTVRLWPMMK